MPFTACTYNVLADSYVRPEIYPRIPPERFDPTVRLPLLVRQLLALDADLFCLQEVEADAFAAFQAGLAPAGYEAQLTLKGRGKPDGCALFYRKSAFVLRRLERLEYHDSSAGRAPTGHIAQVAVLEHEGRLLGVANTHLKWDAPGTPARAKLGLKQIRELIDERTTLAPEVGPAAWIVTGDFNATPGSEVVAALRSAGLEFAHHSLPHAYTCTFDRRARVIDYLFHGGALEGVPIAPPALDDDTPLPGPGQPSDHLALLAQFSWAPL